MSTHELPESEAHFYIDKLEVGQILRVETRHTMYKIERLEDGLYVSGHPEFCPEPKKAKSIGMGQIGVSYDVGEVKENMGMVVVFEEKNDEGNNIRMGTSRVKRIHSPE